MGCVRGQKKEALGRRPFWNRLPCNELKLSFISCFASNLRLFSFYIGRKVFIVIIDNRGLFFSTFLSFVFGEFSHLKKGIPIIFTELLAGKDFFYFSFFIEYFYFVKHFSLQNLKAFSDPKTYTLNNFSKERRIFGVRPAQVIWNFLVDLQLLMRSL